MRPDMLLIKGGRVVDPSRKLDAQADLLVKDGNVARVAAGIMPEPGCTVIDAGGMIISPGFVDLHCHLREPGFEHKETIASGTRAAARGGFTTICCMPNTVPALDSGAAVEFILKKSLVEGVVRVLPVGCITRGRKGQELADMAGMARAGVIGFSDDGQAVADSLTMRRALESARELGLPVIDHCEDAALARGGQVNEGLVSTRLGLKGIPVAAEEIIVARDLALAALTGGHLHVAHVSTAGSVELIRRARKDGIRVTAEVTPHHLTLTEEAVNGYNTSAKVSPPLRTGQDVQALVQGLRENVIDIIATDHAPHADADKQCDFIEAAFGISGLETAFGSLMGLVHSGQFTLHMLIARLTCAPASIIGEGHGNLGTLAVGATADVTILDPAREWVVDPRTFASKGKNTPLTGSVLRGKVVATIAQGKLVYRHDSVTIGHGERLKAFHGEGIQ